MSNIEQELSAEFEALKNELIAKYHETGSRATGNWAETLSVETEGYSAKIVAGYSTDGRGPGKQPPSEAIEQWIVAKGIAARLEKEITLSSLAFLIARKIGREGWKRQDGIVDSVVTPERIQQVIDKVGPAFIMEFSNSILTYLKATS